MIIPQMGWGIQSAVLTPLRLRAKVQRLGAVVPAGDRHEQVSLTERVRLAEAGWHVEQQGALAVAQDSNTLQIFDRFTRVMQF